MYKLFYKTKNKIIDRGGFTLVELLAVVVILAILMTIAIPAVQTVVKRSQKDAIYDYANILFKKTEELIMNNYKAYSFLDTLDECGVTASLDYLELDKNGEYEGYVFYNNLTDEISVYIHDGKYMITGFKNTDTRSKSEVVKKYSNTSDINKNFTHEEICSQNEDLFLCMYNNPNETVAFDVNKLKGPGIMTADINFSYSISDIIRAIAKPGSKVYPRYSGREAESDMIDTVKEVKVVNTNSVTPPATAIDLTPYNNGKKLSEMPVYLWFDSASGILYYGSETGMVNVYLSAADMFKFLSNVKKIDMDRFNFKYILTLSRAFAYCKSLENIDNFKNLELTYVTDTVQTFTGCEKLKEIDFGDWETGNLLSANEMFHHCKSLKKIDVSKWDVSRVEDFTSMFNGCEKLESLDVSNWNTEEAKTFEGTFQNCFNLKYLNVSGWKTSKVVSMIRMFCGDGNLEELDVSKWDTRNLVNAGTLFFGCSKVPVLDLSKWDISNIQCIKGIFANCNKVSKIIFGNTKNYNDLYKDLSDLSQGYGTGSPISHCINLEYVDFSNFEKFPDEANYGYELPSLKTFLVSNSYTGKLVKKGQDGVSYTLTKVG